MTRKYHILGLLGDGIASEIVPEAVKILKVCEQAYDLQLDILGPYPFGSQYWFDSGKKRSWHPEITRDLIYSADGIFKGPVGTPSSIEDVKLNFEVGYLPVSLRSELDLYANIRPCKLRPGIKSVLSDKKVGSIDFVIVRENTEQNLAEASYFGGIKDIGGYFERAGEVEFAADVSIQTQKGCERISRFAFDLCRKRSKELAESKKRVTCSCKWGMSRGDTFFKKVFTGIASYYSDIEADFTWIDGLAYLLLMQPEYYDVIVTPNQYGDIISDLSGALQGSLGVAAALNAGDNHAYAEGTHGSAPDIAGKNIANPISLILSISMLLEWMGEKHSDNRLKRAAAGIDRAVNKVLQDNNVRTPDIGGSDSTQKVGDEIVTKIKNTAHN